MSTVQANEEGIMEIKNKLNEIEHFYDIRACVNVSILIIFLKKNARSEWFYQNLINIPP